MNRIRTIGLLGLLIALPGHTGDADGRFSVRGAGLLTCDIYVAERAKRSNAYYMIGGWIDGYITGLNQASRDTYDVTSFESTELFAQLVQSHCKDHPQDRLFAVMKTIVDKLQKDRVRAASVLVTVKVGERQVELYPEVLSRVREELKRRGLYDGATDGSFDTATHKALAAFQRAQKLKPTGFPDQTTLWRLLRKESGSS